MFLRDIISRFRIAGPVGCGNRFAALHFVAWSPLATPQTFTRLTETVVINHRNATPVREVRNVPGNGSLTRLSGSTRRITGLSSAKRFEVSKSSRIRGVSLEHPFQFPDPFRHLPLLRQSDAQIEPGLRQVRHQANRFSEFARRLHRVSRTAQFQPVKEMRLGQIRGDSHRLGVALGGLASPPQGREILPRFQSQHPVGGIQPDGVRVVGGSGLQPAAALTEPRERREFRRAPQAVREGPAKTVRSFGGATLRFEQLAESQPRRAATSAPGRSPADCFNAANWP